MSPISLEIQRDPGCNPPSFGVGFWSDGRNDGGETEENPSESQGYTVTVQSHIRGQGSRFPTTLGTQVLSQVPTEV